MTADSAAAYTRKRGRSPSYPANSLDVSIERAKVIWAREQRHAAPIHVLQAHFGYTAGTGPANVAIASLKKYGLLVDEGSGNERVAKLTPLALEIIANPDQEDQARYVREAALMPGIHRELWEQFGGNLPSDATLLYELTTRRNFTQGGAKEFISQFRKTIAFARLEEQELSDPPPQTAREQEDVTSPSMASQQYAQTPSGTTLAGQPAQASLSSVDQPAGTMTIPIPLIGSAPVQIVGQFPISEMNWQQLLRVLEAMKPGLVAEPVDHQAID